MLPGGACTIVATFAPVREGDHTAVFTARGAPYIHTRITGTAYAPGVFTVATDPFDVGDKYLTGYGLNDPTPATLTVRNAGPGSIRDVRVTCETGDCSDFQLIAASTAIERDEAREISIFFSPTARGARSATLLLTGDAVTPLRVTVRGRGLVGPIVQVSSAALDFGSAPTVDLRRPPVALPERTIEVTNVGDEPFSSLHPLIESSIGTPAFVVGASTCNDVPPTGKCEMTVRFATLSAGEHRARLRLQPSLGVDVTRVDVELKGVAIANP